MKRDETEYSVTSWVNSAANFVPTVVRLPPPPPRPPPAPTARGLGFVDDAREAGEQMAVGSDEEPPHVGAEEAS